MMRVNKKIQRLITNAAAMIEDAVMDAELHEAAVAQGLTTELIDRGEALLGRLRLTFGSQLESRLSKQAATERANDRLRRLLQEYVIHLEMARAAFRRDPEAWDALELSGRRAQRQADQVVEAKLFYETLVERGELLAEMSAYGMPAEGPTRMLARIEEVELARTAQQVLIHVSRQQTARRDAVAEELRAFMRAFRGYLRLAARERPSIRERYGV